MRIVRRAAHDADVGYLPDPALADMVYRPVLAPSQLVYGGDRLATSCLGCPDAPCSRLRHGEVSPAVSAPGIDDRTVCPTESIGVPLAGEPPSVNRETCVGCGACIARCPSGAIWLNDGAAAVEWNPVPPFEFGSYDEERFDLTRHRLDAVSTVTMAAEEAIAAARSAWLQIQPPALGQLQFAALIRSLLISAGLSAQIGKPGDHAVRIELIGSDDEDVLLGHIEYGTDFLDAARRTLSSAAVLLSRYDADAERLVCVVFCYQLPNARVDLYRVIPSARARLGLHISVVPVGILLLGALLRRTISVRELADFALDDDSAPDLRGPVGGLFGLDSDLLGGLGLQAEK